MQGKTDLAVLAVLLTLQIRMWQRQWRHARDLAAVCLACQKSTMAALNLVLNLPGIINRINRGLAILLLHFPMFP